MKYGYESSGQVMLDLRIVYRAFCTHAHFLSVPVHNLKKFALKIFFFFV